MHGGRGDYDSDNTGYIYVFVITVSILSIIYSGFLIDYYIKNKDDNNYRDYGIVLIVIPIISILLLSLGYFNGDGFIFGAGLISLVNAFLAIVSVIINQKIYDKK
jgi:hypothetical protein